MGFNIKIKGLDELQRKLERMPSDIERIRREILSVYAAKVEKEAKEACPTNEMKESVKVTTNADGNFSVHCSEDAKPYVIPVVQKNKEEMAQEMKIRIGKAWKT